MTQELKANWSVDPTHSEVQFKVKHLAISNVAGTFKLFKGEVQSENEDFNNAAVRFEIDVSSLDTNNNERDKHLKSDLFFDSEKYPQIIFVGSLQKNNTDYILDGALTIRETTRAIKMEVDFTGIGKGRFGDTRAGFEINGKLNRKDFGLNWNLLTEAGGLVVGEEVKLHFDIQMIKKVLKT